MLKGCSTQDIIDARHLLIMVEISCSYHVFMRSTSKSHECIDIGFRVWGLGYVHSKILIMNIRVEANMIFKFVVISFVVIVSCAN